APDEARRLGEDRRDRLLELPVLADAGALAGVHVAQPGVVARLAAHLDLHDEAARDAGDRHHPEARPEVGDGGAGVARGGSRDLCVGALALRAPLLELGHATIVPPWADTVTDAAHPPGMRDQWRRCVAWLERSL